VEVLDHRVIHLDDVLEAIERNLTVRAGPWHVRIDFGNQRPCSEHGGAADIHRYTQAAHARAVRRADLDQRDVESEPPALQQTRHFGQRQRDVIHLA
jgi:hypothetical protein